MRGSVPAPSLLPMSPSTAANTASAIELLDDPVALRRHTRQVAGVGGKSLSESSLRVSGMYCAACAGVIESALVGVDGVVEASVSAASERARVRWDPQRTRMARIVQSVQQAGYGAVPDVAVHAREQRRQMERQALWRLFVAAFCAMQVMMLATPSYVSGPGELAPDMSRLLNWGGWVLSWPVLLFACGPFFQGAWRSIRQRRIGMDVPVSLGILVTFAASSGATFDPGGPFGTEVYFDSLTMFVSFLLGARWLELRARHRAAQSLEDTVLGVPESALRVDGTGRDERVPVEHLQVGDTVRVLMGESVPADGVLLDGAAELSEALLTGESRSVFKGAGDLLVAASVNVGAPLHMRVECVGEDTRIAAIVALMRDALAQRPAAARLADRWAAPFLWTVLLLAAVAGVVWAVLDPSRAVWVVVSVLIVTCPCALSLAAPAAMLAAAGRLARDGVLLQRLDALEALARVSSVYLDKTGTVTAEELQVAEVHWLDAGARGGGRLAAGVEATGLVAAAQTLASWSRHPLARALAAGSAQPEGGRTPSMSDSGAWTCVREEPGQGLEARSDRGERWRLGSAAWVGGVPAGDADQTRLWFGPVGQALVGWSFTEVLRADAVAAVEALHVNGLETIVLSGDQAQRVEAVAAQLGVDGWRAALTPQGKLDEVARAQGRKRCVAMVGDGVNDAPVLARADVSFAMGQGAVMARTQADFVVLSGQVGSVVRSYELARRCMRIVRQNTFWAVGYNLAAVPLALAGLLPPWAAGLGMACSSLWVVTNALRLAGRARPPRMQPGLQLVHGAA